MTLSLRFAFLIFATAAAFGATPLSPPSITAAAGTRSTPAIVAHGDGYVVAWAEERGLLAARVDGDGGLLEPTPSYLGAGGAPALASNGQVLMGAWTCGSYYNPAVCTGVIDPVTMVIRPGARFQGLQPKIIWNGSGWSVAYQHSNFDPILRVAWLDGEGDLIANYDVGSGSDGALASNGTVTLVAWRGLSASAIQLRRIDSSGPSQVTSNISAPPATTFDFRPHLATDGEEFLVLWNRGGGAPSAFALAFDAAGTSKGEASQIQTSGWIEGLAWIGREYAATAKDGDPFYWDETGDTFLVRLARDGVTKSSSLLSGGEGRQAEGDLAYNGTTAVAVWSTARTLRYDEVRVTEQTIEALRVDPAIPPPGPSVLSTAAFEQIDPAIASTPTRHLVAWTEEQAGPGRVSFTLFERSLTPVGAPGRRVAATAEDQRHPAVATDGSRFLLAWTEAAEGATTGTLYGLFVEPDATSGTVRTLAEGVTHAPVAIAHDEMSFLVVWTAADGTLAGRHILASGVPVEQTPIIFGENGFNQDLAWSGATFLLAWESLEIQECQILCAPESIVRAIGLGPDGNRRAGSVPVSLAYRSNPAVIWAGTRFALFADGIVASLFSITGEALGSAVTLPLPGLLPAAGYDGASILLLSNDLFRGLLHRMKLSESLTPLRGPVALATEAWNDDTPAVAPDASALVYHRRTIERPYLGRPYLVIESADRPERGRTVMR